MIHLVIIYFIKIFVKTIHSKNIVTIFKLCKFSDKVDEVIQFIKNNKKFNPASTISVSHKIAQAAFSKIFILR